LIKILKVSLYILLNFLSVVGDDCDWIYVKKNGPALLQINYQSIYNALKPILYDAISIANVSK
jgi:hypothetical protein